MATSESRACNPRGVASSSFWRPVTAMALAARENADSRVFVGYHFRRATDVGVAQGRLVGRYIVRTAL